MTVLLLIPAILSFLLLAAHFLRDGFPPLVAATAALPLLLLAPRPWVARVMQVMLILASIEWVATLIATAQRRSAEGRPWLRMAVILGAVATLALVAAAMFQTRRLKQRYRLSPPDDQSNRP